MTTPYANFWAWFQQNEQHFPSTLEFDAAFGDALSKELEAVQPGLVYEISIPESGQKELIISADGLRELIPYVRGLVEAAPLIEGWTFTAFRPRLDDYLGFKLQFAGRSFDPEKLWCYSRVEDGNFDLIVYHPDYTEDDRATLINGTYILLDMAIGEYDVMTGVRYIDHQLLPDNPASHGLYPFAELRKRFDEYKRLN